MIARRPPAAAVRILCDFDGTITPRDTTDLLLERMADPAWLEVEQDWLAGRIDARSCMRTQVSLLAGTWERFESVLDEVAIDPAFPAFVRLCEARGFELIVTSDGLDRAVAGVLARAGLSLPVRANRPERSPGGHWSLAAPHGRADCTARSAHCKCASLPGPGCLTVVVGDGRSDVCVARRADFVLAREADDAASPLLSTCRRESLPHAAFSDFGDGAAALAAWDERRIAA